jgi:hypothetical protein
MADEGWDCQKHGRHFGEGEDCPWCADPDLPAPEVAVPKTRPSRAPPSGGGS